MKQSLTFLAALLSVCFVFGALSGHAMASDEQPSLEMTPQTNDTLAIPPETIPADPDNDMPMIYDLIEPSETLSEPVILYAV